MSAVAHGRGGWLPEHQRECEGFWLRERNGGLHVEWRDPVTRRMRSKRVGTDYSEAYAATKQLSSMVRLGNSVAPKSATVYQVAQDWLDRQLVPKCKPATVANYRYLLERFILPTLAERRFADIDPLTWNAFFSRIAEFDTADPKRKKNIGVTPEQVNATMKVVKSLARWAFVNGYAAENTAAGVRMTTVEHRERETLTAEQFEFMLGFADEYYLVHLSALFYGGVRGCELAALPWRNVTFRDDGRLDIRISQSLSRGTIGTPKTKSSARLITLPPHVADLLRVHMARQAATQPPHPDDLVFTTRRGNRLNLQNLRGRVFYPALDRANAHLAKEDLPALPKVVLHGLRHSCLSMLRSVGVADVAVQKLAGHTSMRTTDMYTHIDEQYRAEVALALDAAHHTAIAARKASAAATSP